MSEQPALPTGPRFRDLTGQRFGRWTVVRFLETRKRGKASNAYWWCRCDCGNEGAASTSNLKSGGTGSCGCAQREASAAYHLTHGMTDSDEFKIWLDIKKRCYNPKFHHFHLYGGRGIGMCDRWRDSFEAFHADMGPRPSPGHSVDRIDTNGNYEPGNCRWATDVEQARNRRNNHLITFRGKTQSMAAWAEETGLSYFIIRNRVGQMGWDVERALTTPPMHHGGRYRKPKATDPTAPSEESAR